MSEAHLTPPDSQGGMFHTQAPFTQQASQRLRQGERRARIDYFTFTTRTDLNQVLNTVESAFELENSYTKLPRGLNGYHEGFKTVEGVTISYTFGREECFVSIPGKACTLLSVQRIVELGIALSAKPTRLDVAVDGCPFTPQMVREAWKDGNVVTKVNREGWKSYDWQESNTGETFYLGSPDSDRRSRCYTKIDEQERLYEDGTPITRWETQLRRDRAVYAWMLLRDRFDKHDDLEQYFPHFALGIISDHVRFADTRLFAAKYKSSAITLKWWADFVENAEKVKTWVSKKITVNIEKIEHYLMQQVSGTFATWFEHLRIQGKRNLKTAFKTFLQTGQSRMNNQQRALLKVAIASSPHQHNYTQNSYIFA
jgi:DNA relaxase NicK